MRARRFVVGSSVWDRDRDVSITRVIEGTVIEASATDVAKMTFVTMDDAGSKARSCSLGERFEWRGTTRRFGMRLRRSWSDLISETPGRKTRTSPSALDACLDTRAEMRSSGMWLRSIVRRERASMTREATN